MNSAGVMSFNDEWGLDSFTAGLTGRNPGFSLPEDTDDLFVGKTLLQGDVLMWLTKT